MAGKQTIIIAGASARAAAFSALRAGLEPYCFDLFADADLAARCPVVKLDAAGYPHNLLEEIRQAPPGPWMYTGGLENHPRLVEAISRERPLWGMNGDTLRGLRSPERLARVLESTKAPSAAVCMDMPGNEKVWLVKPLRGAGGAGIHFWDGQAPPRKGFYYQEYLGDRGFAAIMSSDGPDSGPVGFTKQLVGVSWLNAQPFQYCGSIGPLQFDMSGEIRDLNWIGWTLWENFRVRGLFGIDCVYSNGEPVPVDVNPRYTASVEVLEYATGRQFLRWHQAAFDPTAPATNRKNACQQCVGKAILFAHESFTFPADGPWLADLDPRRPIEALPAYADIPHAGTFIKRGWPVLTFFATGATVEDVREKLKVIAAELNERFWPQSGAL
jgi:predicted ATP-grasp superfamily ATP-dependent carboligase